MILYRTEVKTRTRKVRIRPVGDLQIGAEGFRKDLWRKCQKDIILDRDSYVIGMGDYSDAFRQTVSFKLRHSLLEDSSAYQQFDDFVRDSMDKIIKEFEPFKHRIIGLHEGHHFHTFKDGTTSTQYMCGKLGTKYLGFVGLVKLVINQTGRRYPIDIFSTHGCGGAVHVHSDVSKLERNIMPFWDADLFLRGHSTKVFVIDGHPLNKLTTLHDNEQTLRVIRKNRLLVNTGGFMEGYVEGAESYVERNNMPPCALGWAVVTINLTRDAEQPVKISAQAITE